MKDPSSADWRTQDDTIVSIKNMFLKSLELNGFKSFAQKTTLEFPKGITAIVGPNGSGKSNVIDAIRWILGERESKNLRSGKAEDLIFAGTPQRPRSSLAQVAIYLDNNSGFFPVNFEEVSVSREVSRDGASSYFVNKSEVRAKDVADFFARSRLGTKGIAIINQGSSDMFVKASPEERQAMVEEVLGLKEYQLKKSEAERKLKNTLNNLEKIKLIIEEVSPRLKTLKRQVSKYQNRDQKQNELKETENFFFGIKTSEIKNVLAENGKKISALNQNISAKLEELSVLEQNLKNIESTEHRSRAVGQLKERKSALASKQPQIQKELGRIEARLEILSVSASGDESFKKEEMFALLKEIKNSLEQSVKAKETKAVIETAKNIALKIGDFLKQPALSRTKETENLEKTKDKIIAELAVAEQELKIIENEESELSKNLEEFNEKFRKAFELKEAKKDEIRNFENDKKYLVFENEKLNLRLDDLKNDWVKNERDEKEFEKTHDLVLAAAPTQPEELERKMFRLRAELMNIGEIDESLIKEAREVEAHYNHLSEQSADLNNASVDLSALIEELKKEITLMFNSAFGKINEEFNKFFQLMFGGGNAKLKIYKKQKTINKGQETEYSAEEITAENDPPEQEEESSGIDIELSLPKKRIKSLEILSGGEKSLVSIAALFALISVSPPPFLVLDEVDAPLDDKNSLRFSEMIKEFSRQAQFIVVTHNRIVMEAADVLYGVTMNPDGTSKLLSLKMEEAKQV